MFKRLKTSISNPPQIINYMKDSWWRVILYLLLVPILLTIPLIVRSFVTDEMTSNRYALIVDTISSDFRSNDAQIIDGVFTSTSKVTAKFEYFNFIIGDADYDPSSVNIVFGESDLIMYISSVEIDRRSYEDLNLSNHDFSSIDINEIKELAFSIRLFFEGQSVISMMDVLLTYFTGLFDYIFYVLLLGLLGTLFIQRAPIPFKFRLKLSIYLTTVFVVIEFILALFYATNLGFISFLTAYIYHMWAYRSMKVIEIGGQ
jgi:hypothetical protein